MRIECPTCAAAYDVPDALLAGRKAVRCARCGSQWTPGQPAAAEPHPSAVAPEAISAPLPGPPQAEPVAPPPAGRLMPPAVPAVPARRLGLSLAWMATALVIALAGWGAIAWRDRIMQLWPPSVRVYAALGLSHNPP